MRIYTTPESYWKENKEALKSDKMPSPPLCKNLKNCEFYPDTVHFPKEATNTWKIQTIIGLLFLLSVLICVFSCFLGV